MIRISGIPILALFVMSASAQQLRVSWDGVALPMASENKAMPVKAPVVGEVLGSLPEQLTDRVYSSNRSKTILDGLVKKGTRLDWFVTGYKTADVAMFRLNDGRVSLISLIWNQMPDARFKQISAECDQFSATQSQDKWKATRGAFVKCEIARYNKTGAHLVVGTTPWNWYLLTHDVKPDVAEGIRMGDPVVGMTEQELRVAVGGEPKVVQANSSKQLLWETPKATGPFHLEYTEDGEMDPLLGFDSRSPSRMTADIKDGVVVNFSKPSN